MEQRNPLPPSPPNRGAEGGQEVLSQRELEVLHWLAAGASNREIGRRLYITESTVKRHVYNIFGKLSVRNRTQAALKATELGNLPTFQL
jgi:ATP/maltotriose-dependent transcriptional regulator MalT